MEDTPSIPWDHGRLGWLGLAWFSGFGSRSLRKFRSAFQDDGERAFRADRKILHAIGLTERQIHTFVTWRSDVDLEMFQRRLHADNIRFVLPTDDEFPLLLANVSDPPGVLFIRGTHLRLIHPIAVVGTRSMTPYGARAAEAVCHGLVAAGCEIISGLALGIDAHAHKAALDAGGVVTAILPGGCNDAHIYPQNNFSLAQRIVENRGSLVSEFPPGTEAFKHHFPLRNRLIASLAFATVVIEAAESSGSLITARLALEENRDVFAVPGPIFSEQSSGTNSLLRQGAIPCTSAADILEHFQIASLPTPPAIALNTDETRVLNAIDHPRHIDDLIRELNHPTATIASWLSTLELKGCIDHHGGGVYARTPRGKALCGADSKLT